MILQSKKVKYLTVAIVSSSTCHEVMGLNAMIFGFWIRILNEFFTFLFHIHQEAL